MTLSTLRRLAAVGSAAVGAVVVAVGFAAAPAAAVPRAAEPRPVTTVEALDLQRYSGTWLQLAAIPQPFQAQCVRDTRATYTPLPDGLVKVENSCVQADGSTSAIEGRARVAGPGPARLEVTFVQFAGQWIFAASGPYWVIGLDRDYQWAVVGSPDRASGFVLSRTSTLSPRQINAVLGTVLRNGYDPCAFQITATTGGIEQNLPLCRAAVAELSLGRQSGRQVRDAEPARPSIR
ncbi:MAG: lipocalin family protein [Angustibacter sp.]